MSKQIYFGTGDDMQYVKCVMADLAAGQSGHNLEAVLLSGELFSRRSGHRHKVFSMEWQGQAAELRKVLDFAYRNEPLYWLNPFAIKNKSVLPPDWASPFYQEKGWTGLGLRGEVSTTAYSGPGGLLRPSRTLTLTNPTKTSYTSIKDVPGHLRLFIPIPPDMKLLFGWSGTNTSSRIEIRVHQNWELTNSLGTSISPLTLASNQLADQVYSGANVDGVWIYAHVPNDITDNVTVQIGQMTAALVPISDAATTLSGDWTFGYGNRSMEITEDIAEILHSAGVGHSGRSSLAFTMKETTRRWK